MITTAGEASHKNYLPGDFIHERPYWVPEEVWKTLGGLRAKVLKRYEPSSNYEAFSQEPYEVARRLAVLERLGTDEKMKAVWEYLSKRERDSSLPGTPHTGNPLRGVSEGAYQRYFKLESNQAIPDADERLKHARQEIVEVAAKYIMKPDPILRGKAQISVASLKRETEEVKALLEAARKIRTRLLSPGRGENWGELDMPAALGNIVWALEIDLKEIERPFYENVSGNEGSTYSRVKIHVLRLNGLILSLFEAPLPSIVAPIISIVTETDITRQDVEAMVGQYRKRALASGSGKKKRE